MSAWLMFCVVILCFSSKVLKILFVADYVVLNVSAKAYYRLELSVANLVIRNLQVVILITLCFLIVLLTYAERIWIV